ncbi:mobile mystery protein B [Polaribacter sp. MSW13]|uniref:Mobile mystery protein B n=1 Tax=Polaribacter marinus TaxID=2916838 RepID=A0A9X2AMI0_9FLAO|nr:mobile mystery protein B [Polaribacter marinus]MCI2230280.1 mobile mystery protein B [Polaribacter marinus]
MRNKKKLLIEQLDQKLANFKNAGMVLVPQKGWAGNFRKTEKSIGIPWTQIGIELKNLLDDTKYWIENKTFPPEEIAIRFKHRIVSIHCFSNGNGRHSRMMADIIMESIFGNEIFSWHQSNIIKANETRNQYIKALREADNGNFKQLIEFAKN